MPRQKDRKGNGSGGERAISRCPESLSQSQRLRLAGEEIAEVLEWYHVRFVSDWEMCMELGCNEDFEDPGTQQ